MPRSHDRSAKPDRRSVVLAGALVAATALPSAGTRAADAGLATAADLLARVNQFLSSLEPEKRKLAAFAWDGPEWRGWNYFGSSDFIKPGLRLEQMSASQKAAAWDLLTTVLSANGLEKAKNVMTLQERPGRARRRARRALLGALLVRRLRRARREGGVGVSTGGAPSKPLDCRTRRPDCFRHALLVLRQSQPRPIRNARRPGHAQG